MNRRIVTMVWDAGLGGGATMFKPPKFDPRPKSKFTTLTTLNENLPPHRTRELYSWKISTLFCHPYSRLGIVNCKNPSHNLFLFCCVDFFWTGIWNVLVDFVSKNRENTSVFTDVILNACITKGYFHFKDL